ncbi:glycosyltransferase family A protein [Brevundimonas sp.]|uniref:glycosyltransferase family 2 protein n=1 Tax=Brevundimonas sp. TaxID=1871086 RepID=UPI002625C1F7|nr:glycosyltransferase family A protein [Brevundimonas sp.]
MLSTGPMVSLLLVTRRPWLLPAVWTQLERQTYANTELVVVLHGHRMADLGAPEARVLEQASSVLELRPDVSLGHCLNAAIAEARGTFVAKIDDDDLYGSNYLAEAVHHLVAGHGDIVGKAEFYVYLAASGTTLLRHPGASLRSVDCVHGPTLAFSRALGLRYPFRDITLGGGNAFQEDCRLGGQTVYATSRKNFMYLRRAVDKGHTWLNAEAELMQSGLTLRERRHFSVVELFGFIDDREIEGTGLDGLL